jgi:ABC-type multidrug transport system ATPase subunit
MSRLELSRVLGNRLARVDAEWEPGMHVVLGDVSDGAAELVAFASGLLRPKRGKVRVDGKDPFKNPATRRRIGSLAAVEPAPEAADFVLGAVERALGLRGTQRDAVDVLETAGIAHLGDRTPESLDAVESRALSLALALAVPPGGLLALSEPLAAGLERSRTVELLEEHAARGTCVLSTTASLRDAADLSGRALVLERGRLVRESPFARAAPAERPLEIVVRVDDARKFAAVLSADPVVSSVSVEGDRAPPEVVVRGTDADAAALAVQRAAKASGSSIFAIRTRARGPDVERATTAKAPPEPGGRVPSNAAQPPPPGGPPLGGAPTAAGVPDGKGAPR